MSKYVDAHCHLNLVNHIAENGESDQQEAIKTITVTNAPSFYHTNHNSFYSHSNINVALGLHPQLVLHCWEQISQFEQYINTTRFIGEIGLDGSREFKSTYTLQIKLFQQVLEIIKTTQNKILSIHSRNAAKDTIDILSSTLQTSDHKVILHWYAGSITDLKRAASKGFYFSINHKMFGSEKAKKLIDHMPAHLILTETDAPFTFSKSINTRTKSLENTLTMLAGIKQKTYAEIEDLIYDNFKALLL